MLIYRSAGLAIDLFEAVKDLFLNFYKYEKNFYNFNIDNFFLCVFAESVTPDKLLKATINGIEWTYVVLDETKKTCKIGGLNTEGPVQAGNRPVRYRCCQCS